MPCREDCGSCCDPVVLDQEQVERVFAIGPLGQQATWLTEHWMPLRAAKDGDGVAFKCINYDVEGRRCLAYDSRPQVCQDFPFYRRPVEQADLNNICGYQAEQGRTVLPLVEVR